MSFFDLKRNDIITTTYTMYPSYNLFLSFSLAISTSATSSFISIFPSKSIKTQRTFKGLSGEPITGSYNLSGCVTFITNKGLSSKDKTVINQLRNIYASASFKKGINYTSSSIYSSSVPTLQSMSVINIPEIFYGSKIKQSSFQISYVLGALSAYWTDDGYGGIYLSSSFLGVSNQLVGCIFYEYGLVYLGHNSQLTNPSDGITINFSGTNTVPTTMFLCRAPKASANFSNNPSFIKQSGSISGSVAFGEITTEQPKTFITSVGLYDENYKLVGIAKLSNPILNDEQTSILLRLKLNY